MQKIYSTSFDHIEEAHKELENLVSQGFKIVQFQLLQTAKTTDFNYCMFIVYEEEKDLEQEREEGWAGGYAARVAEEKAGYGPYEK